MSNREKNNPLLELLINIIIPSVILMKFSGEEDLGALSALLLALAFPLLWGARDLLQKRKVNFIAALGLISILLTGGIGLLKLDTQWLAIKEAAIPGLLGLAVLISTRTRYPLVKTLLFNPAFLDVAIVRERLEARNAAATFDARLQAANYMLSGTFFFSAGMNYLLATWIVTSPTGTKAFNEELGQLTLLSYPAIAIPSTIMMIAILWYLAKMIHNLTGLQLSEIMKK